MKLGLRSNRTAKVKPTKRSSNNSTKLGRLIGTGWHDKKRLELEDFCPRRLEN